MPVENTKFSTVSGIYYVGMKREEAKNKQMFDCIDSNHDQTLQGSEICNERDREVEEIKNVKYGIPAMLSVGASNTLTLSYLMTTTGIAAPLAPLLAAAGLVSIVAAEAFAIFADDGEAVDYETQQYRKQHKLDANF